MKRRLNVQSSKAIQDTIKLENKKILSRLIDVKPTL